MWAKTLKYLLSEQSARQSEHSNCSIRPTPGATYILITHSPPMIPNIHQISQLLLSFVKKTTTTTTTQYCTKVLDLSLITALQQMDFFTG